MNISHVRVIAQHDPVQTLTARYGEAVATARRKVDLLTDALRDLDKTAALLAEAGVTIAADLGPVGDSAAAARRDMESDTREMERTFALPQHSVRV